MTKKLLVIESCSECPNCVTVCDRWAAAFMTGCKAMVPIKDTGGKDAIPDWCPLPDAPEERKPLPIGGYTNEV